ncbi:Swi3-domain-containing protein [Lindgomyces ingoldianus]|uniref:Swi3-domain-containing protein n=1 Tax=Lindgomyces ingoldianus TaxID=673940 RepID=A0ACB6R1X3_9PLEO|nr:Swi3-domain-containing protein [Lindgomyces ingoldianus]KAF2473141.1 Swi3-domain-containing protein [Lindgomyces ingoldianus]
MMALTTPPPNVPTADELDDILNGIINGEDAFDTSNIQPRQEVESRPKAAATDSGLGIDEEIKIVKKRQPIPKLDDNRLLSVGGVPRLRRICKERLRFKGKGHEYGDVARMLNMYQLWLDDLYPRAKFADGLAMIEKLGHTKRIQFMRKEWIDEGKPKHTTEIDSDENVVSAPDKSNVPGTDRMDDIPSGNTAEHTVHSPRETEQGKASNQPRGPNDILDGDGPGEDELDALLAESTEPTFAPTPVASLLPKTADIEGDPFADDMEAMAELEGMW